MTPEAIAARPGSACGGPARRWIRPWLRLGCVGVAWAVGWVIYLTAAILWGLDGLPAMIIQPVAGAVVGGVGVALALVAGLALRVAPIGRLWRGRPGRAALVVAACLALMALGSSVGLTASYEDPDTGREFRAIHPAAALGGYFGLLFALANWPLGGLGESANRPATAADRE